MAESGRLTPKQQRAIAALLTARDVADAAQAAGVGYRTLRGWLKQPAFVAELDEAQRQALSATIRRLTSLSMGATVVLARVMADNEATPAARIRAADIVLSRLMSLKELIDVEQRLAAVEATLAERQGKL